MSDTKIGIGSTIWRFDLNHRIYKDHNSGPDYRSYWLETKITGETPRSWLVGNWAKCPKKGDHSGWAFSLEEVDDNVWSHDERHKIIRCVERCDVFTLRKIAELVGYTTEVKATS